jgi:hypothetical protein
MDQIIVIIVLLVALIVTAVGILYKILPPPLTPPLPPSSTGSGQIQLIPQEVPIYFPRPIYPYPRLAFPVKPFTAPMRPPIRR